MLGAHRVDVARADAGVDVALAVPHVHPPTHLLLDERAACTYMKMITLAKLRDGLRDGVHEVKVPEDVAERARVPIERMVAIS